MFLTSFVTGFATQMAKDIDERDKEIQNDVKASMTALLKKRQKALTESETRRDELRKQARELRAYVGTNLTETEVARLIETGQAEVVLTNLKAAGKEGITYGREEMSKLLTLPEEYKKTTADVIKEQSQLVEDPNAVAYTPETKGVFGLSTRAGTAKMKEYLAEYGLTEEDLRKTKLVQQNVTADNIDLSMFKNIKGETFNRRLDAAKIAVDDALKSGDEAKIKTAQNNLARLQKIASDPDKGGMTFSNHMTSFNSAIASAVARNTAKLGGVTFTFAPDGTLTQYTGSPEGLKAVNDIILQALKDAAQRYMDKNGVITKEAADALNAKGIRVIDGKPDFSGFVGSGPIPKSSQGAEPAAPAQPGTPTPPAAGTQPAKPATPPAAAEPDQAKREADAKADLTARAKELMTGDRSRAMVELVNGNWNESYRQALLVINNDKATTQEKASAQFIMGYLQLKGLGGDINVAEGTKNIFDAAKAGYPQAINLLRKDALELIKKSPEREQEIRKMFKQQTGKDL